MLRQIIIPDNKIYPLLLPDEFLGHKVEIIAFPVRKENVKKNILRSKIRNNKKDETEYLLANPINRKILKKALKNAQKGKLTEVNIDKYLP